ncbi:MAG: cytochrome c oxidase subunit II [Gaiellales bacterium]
MEGRSHLNRIVGLWVVLSVIGVLAVIFLLGPHMPPGRASSDASDQTEINIILAAILTPIVLAVWVYFGYALATFRQQGDQIVDGPPIKGHSRLQLGWVSTTTAIVLALAVTGTFELIASHSSASGAGVGGGQGPTPIATPSSGNPLQVQVIAQQWQFTYRFPQYGGVETFALALPVNRTVEFHVTSLDVIHSFWAYQLGVKVDAVPGADNVAFVTVHKPERFTIRCSELCGLWHGNMFATGHVLSQSAFASWVAGQQQANAPATGHLPRYARVYFPDPYGRAG